MIGITLIIFIRMDRSHKQSKWIGITLVNCYLHKTYARDFRWRVGKKIWTKEICNLCYLSGKSGCFRSHDNTR